MSAGDGGEPRRILFVIDGLWVGGTERSLAELLPRLVAAGFRPTVACFRRYPDEGVEAEVLAAGHEVRFLPATGLRRQVLALRRVIRDLRPAILHSSLFRSNLLARLAAIGLDVVVVNSLVNTPYVPVRYRDPRVRPAKLRLVNLVDAITGRLLADHFHAVSEAAKRSAVTSLRIPEPRITVIARGRDPGRLGLPGRGRRQAARRALALAPEDEVLVNVGRQEFQKGQQCLLRAVARLTRERPRLRLLVAGREGAASEELTRARLELGLEERVLLLGHRTDLPEVLASADLFVFPSLFEGLPGAVIEAMALGLPIVASDIPSVREVVVPGVNALLVPPESIEELGVALSRLLDDRKTLAALGAASRKLFEERFTLDHSAARMIAFYRRLGVSE